MQTWNDTAQTITDKVKLHVTYQVSAWVRVGAQRKGTQNIDISLTVDGRWISGGKVEAIDGRWYEVGGLFKVEKLPSSVIVSVQGPSPGVDLMVAGLRMFPVDRKSNIQASQEFQADMFHHSSERTKKMAPLPSPSATDAPQTTAVPSTGLLCSAFFHLPFSFPLLQPKPSVLDQAAGGLHSSLLSAADRCVKVLAAALSEHPFLKPLISMHSEFHNFCQMHCRSPKVVRLPSGHNFAAILPGDSVAGLVVANGITNFLNIYNTLLIVRLVLTWFPNSPPAIVSPLSTLCDPYLNIFRGIIPPLGGTLDLSPILAFLVLNAFTSTAAALPAELPVTTTSQQNAVHHCLPSSLTTTQEKWMKRLNNRRSKNSGDAC
ncbi:hypothetical protein Cni_G20348 [Canna indica]|uniref:CBM-cenC domain-containing protein n=1 Tax=Canna indica TaxID=4628 RepID=A0AAQ3KNQ4_9LILI|nr:hypothetical protein Cni_G20348 [Canna indica]